MTLWKVVPEIQDIFMPKKIKKYQMFPEAGRAVVDNFLTRSLRIYLETRKSSWKGNR